MDAKGRMLLPAMLLRQLPKAAKNKLVINRGYEKCLVLYAANEFEEIADEVRKLNPHIKINRDFARYFFRGATELDLDAANRLLLPKALLEHASIERELILFAYNNIIEVWNPKMFEKKMADEPMDFASMAEKIFGQQP